MPRYDFLCECGALFEAITPTHVVRMPCLTCSPTHLLQPDLRCTHETKFAQRQLSAPSRIHIH